MAEGGRGVCKRNDTYGKNTRTLILLLIIPIIIIFLLNFVLTYTESVSSVKKNLQSESEQKLELLSVSLAPMYQLVDTRRRDWNFSTRYLRNAHFTDAFFSIKTALQRDAVWVSFFDSISYYNRVENKVFTYNSVSTAEEFFGWLQEERAAYPHASLKADPGGARLLCLQGNQVRTMRAGGISGQEGLIFAVPLEMGRDNIPRSYMIFTVQDKTLESLWGNREGLSYVLCFDQIPIYASKDDAAVLKNGVPESIPDGKADACMAHLGSLAIGWEIHMSYFIQSLFPTILAEVIISFLILSVSLVLLLHYSRKSYEPVRRILGHFPQYAEKGKLVDEFQYLDFMLDDLTNSKRLLEQSNRKMRKENYLYSICSSPVSRESELYQKCLDAGIRVDRRWYACAVLSNAAADSRLYAALTELGEAEQHQSNLYAMEVNEEKVVYLISSDLDKEELAAGLKELCKEAGNAVAVSPIREGAEKIPEAYLAICGPMAGKESETEDQAEYPVLELQFLQAAVAEGNMAKAEFAAGLLVKSLAGCGDTVRGMILYAAGAMLFSGNGEELNARLSQIRDFDAAHTCRCLEGWFDEYRQRMEVVPKKRKKALTRNMHNILKYIEENAASSNFTIGVMAADFGTSASNLGHQFKQATGQTLSRFIEEWKIRKAEELLRDGEAVSVVAGKLGYLTTPAFTEAFKRTRGMTPSAWRENGGQRMEQNDES